MVIGVAILSVYHNNNLKGQNSPKTGVMLSHLKKNPFYDNGNLNLYVMHSLKFVYVIANSILFLLCRLFERAMISGFGVALELLKLLKCYAFIQFEITAGADLPDKRN